MPALVESLETRQLLATITVTSLEDNTIEDGLVTLREALLAAERNRSIDGSEAGDPRPQIDTIVFDSALFTSGPQRIQLREFDRFRADILSIRVSSSIHLQGPGADLLTIERDPTVREFRLFEFRPSAIELSGLTLSGGVAVSGGDGNDDLRGHSGRDLLTGHAGADRLDGHRHDDTLSGGDGPDVLNGEAGRDVLVGGADDDILNGHSGFDRFNSGPGQDSLDLVVSIGEADQAFGLDLDVILQGL